MFGSERLRWGNGVPARLDPDGAPDVTVALKVLQRLSTAHHSGDHRSGLRGVDRHPSSFRFCLGNEIK